MNTQIITKVANGHAIAILRRSQKATKSVKCGMDVDESFCEATGSNIVHRSTKLTTKIDLQRVHRLRLRQGSI